jgi:hypothetical protein
LNATKNDIKNQIQLIPSSEASSSCYRSIKTTQSDDVVVSTKQNPFQEFSW